MLKTEQDVFVSQYEGKPVLNIPMNSKTFSFGLAKAKAILGNLDSIKEFVDTYEVKEIK